jgi:O-methyltransferase
MTATPRARLSHLRDLWQRWRMHRAGDDYSSYVLAEWAANRFYPAYRFSEYGLRWLHDEAFFDWYREWVLEPGAAPNYHSADRKHFMRSLLGLVQDVPGSLAECGTYRGATANLLGVAAARHGRRLHLFDSFEGLSSPGATDGTHWSAQDLSAPQDVVAAAVATTGAEFSLHPGWIPSRFNDVADQRFAFVHIDVDLYQPTIDSLRFFHPRMAPGGIMLLDDVGFITCPGATEAAQEWAAEAGEVVVDVPTGQGFVIVRGSGGR